MCENYLRYFSLSMQEKSTLFTRRRSRKTWWPFFLSTKDVVPSIEPISAVASYLPTLSSQKSSTAPGACMSAETRVLGVNLILLPSRFLRQGRLTGNNRSVLVQVMSVSGKERRPCTTPCSYKVHLVNGTFEWINPYKYRTSTSLP